MNLSALQISLEEAEAGVREYADQLASERTVEDEAVLAAFRAAKRGHPVISLTRAFEIAGRFPDRDGNPDAGLPRLAIIRADATECHVRATSSYGNAWVFSPDRNMNSRGALVSSNGEVRVPLPEFPGWRTGGRTVVPSIPPRHRPHRRRLHLFHILWEVDAWTPEPPVDPALLRHIRGDLWSVMAVWDLTPIERAVLSQRARHAS